MPLDALQVTDERGAFRFPGLAPGRYQVSAQLEGFSAVDYPNVQVNIGRNTDLQITLTPALEETITVTSESPLLDERKITTGTTVSQIELEKIPTARDPWAILTQSPGVVSDRINVGGNESGQQAVFSAGGQASDENTFAVDGVVITDMSAIGSSPTYYDFDQFEEMQVSTGGSDITAITGGVTMRRRLAPAIETRKTPWLRPKIAGRSRPRVRRKKTASSPTLKLGAPTVTFI